MNTAEIINQAKTDGVEIRLAGGYLKISGGKTAVTRWANTLRQNKPEILAYLKAANDADTLTSCSACGDVIFWSADTTIWHCHTCNPTPPAGAQWQTVPRQHPAETKPFLPGNDSRPGHHDPLAALVDLPLLAGDHRFIDEKLFHVPTNQHSVILNEYRRHWLESAGNEPLEHRRDNSGRFAANSWLRQHMAERSR